MRFSMARMLLVPVAFAAPLAAFRNLGTAGIVIAIIIGCSVATICLTIRTSLIWPMLRTGMLTIAGGAIGLMFCPMIRPPYNDGDELVYIAFGGLIGFVVGVMRTQSQIAKKNRANSE